MSDCIFCKIVNKEIPATVVYEDEYFLAFNDINPVAETHMLIIPKEHISTLLELNDSHKEIASRLLYTAKEIARQKNLKGYKLHMNVGEEGGQVVMHIHLHLLAGKAKGHLKAL